MEPSESKKKQAMKLFNEAWHEREDALIRTHSEQVAGLERDIHLLRKELQNAQMAINQLVSDKEQLQETIKSAAQQNLKFEKIKATLIDTLAETDGPQSVPLGRENV